MNYNQKLKEKFQHHPQIKRIARHRHLPKSIYCQIKEQRIMREARRRKYVFLFHLCFIFVLTKSITTVPWRQRMGVCKRNKYELLLASEKRS